MTTAARLLRDELNDAVEAAVSPVLNHRLGPTLPPLRWRAEGGGGIDPIWNGLAASGDYDENETRSVVEQWAVSLGFEVRESHGTVEFEGRAGDVRVAVWGVVDREAFEKGRMS